MISTNNNMQVAIKNKKKHVFIGKLGYKYSIEQPWQ